MTMIPHTYTRRVGRYQRGNKNPYIEGEHNVTGQFVMSDLNWSRRGRDRMEVGFTTTCAINTYHH